MLTEFTVAQAPLGAKPAAAKGKGKRMAIAGAIKMKNARAGQTGSWAGDIANSAKNTSRLSWKKR